MDRGAPAGLIGRAGLALVLAAAACHAGDGPAIGDPFPLVADPAGALRVAWVLRPDDYLTCQTAADGVRRLQRRHGDALPVTVVSVGAHPEWLRGFLRRQRIEASLVSLSERDYRRRFGGPAAPRLYLLRGGTVLDIAPGRGVVYPAARWGASIDSVLGSGARAKGRVGPSFTVVESGRTP